MDHTEGGREEEGCSGESEEGRRTEEEGTLLLPSWVAENNTFLCAHTIPLMLTARCPRFAFLPLTTTTTISSRSLTNHTEGGREEEGCSGESKEA